MPYVAGGVTAAALELQSSLTTVQGELLRLKAELIHTNALLAQAHKEAHEQRGTIEALQARCGLRCCGCTHCMHTHRARLAEHACMGYSTKWQVANDQQVWARRGHERVNGLVRARMHACRLGEQDAAHAAAVGALRSHETQGLELVAAAEASKAALQDEVGSSRSSSPLCVHGGAVQRSFEARTALQKASAMHMYV